jgi:hypothetical protein
MPKYKVEITVDGSNVNQVRTMVAKTFPGQETTVDKVDFNKSRGDRLGDAESLVQDAKDEIECLKDELQEWLDNLPENLQQGSKADELQEAIDALEQINDELEQVDWSSVSFPGMF